MIHSLLNQLKSHQNTFHSAPSSTARFQPEVQHLEVRSLPSSGTVLALWSQGTYGTNGLGPTAVAYGVSEFDPATGAENVLFRANVPNSGNPSDPFPTPSDLAGTAGNLFTISANQAGTGTLNGAPQVTQDSSTIQEINPTTGQTTTFHSAPRQTLGLAVAADGGLLALWSQGTYGTNGLAPTAVAYGVSEFDPATGAENVLFRANVPNSGNPSDPFPSPSGLAETAGNLFTISADQAGGGILHYNPPEVTQDSSTIQKIDLSTGQASNFDTSNRQPLALFSGSMPVVTGMNPASGPVVGGTSVTITGINLGGVIAVNFGAVAGTITSTTPTQIVVTSPAGVDGTVDVTVTTPDRTSATTAADLFTYGLGAAPTVTEVGPATGPSGGGTTLVITGTNFTATPVVTFGSSQATVISDSADRIVATSPGGSPGTVDVTVTTPLGTSQISAADRFTYVAPPSVTGVNPASGPVVGGTSVTITGINLGGVIAVNFGAVAGTITSATPTQIVVTSPAGAPGAVTLTLTTPGGTAPGQFIYLPAPTITGVSPPSDTTTGGTEVTITGTNFTGATAVTFGSTPAMTFTVNSPTSITATDPSATTAGHVDVTVSTAGGSSVPSPADVFTYDSPSPPVPPSPPSPPPPSPMVAVQPVLVGGQPDGTAEVFTPSAGQYAPSQSLQPFGPLSTDVRTAVGDVNGDGIPDYVFATGPGTEFMITVLSGAVGNAVLVPPFDPFPPNPGQAPFNAGGFVSVGTFAGNGRAQIVVTPDQAGGPRVTIYDLNPANVGQNAATGGLTVVDNYFVNLNPNFRGGLRTAVGDLNGDGVPDLVVAAGFGGGPVVEVLDGAKALTTTGQPDSDYLVGHLGHPWPFAVWYNGSDRLEGSQCRAARRTRSAN